MRVRDLIEAPIEDLNLIGNWDKSSSFNQAQDRKILSNPRAQEHLKHKWAKTVVPFNMYFVNSPGAAKVAETGEVDQAWIDEKLPKIAAQIHLRDDAVNVIYTNNRGDERLPMTAWIIAHRLGHATNRPGNYNYQTQTSEPQVWEQQEVKDLIFAYLAPIFRDGYGYDYFPDSERRYEKKQSNFANPTNANRSEQILLAFFEAIGTMRSARSKNIRQYFEFYYELFAQYIITGKVTFNPLPKRLSFGRFGQDGLSFKGSEHDYAYYNDQLQGLAEALGDYFDTLMHALVGRTFVM
jgi:hypothetical protein